MSSLTPSDFDDLTPSRGIVNGLLISIWIWAALLLWLVA